jgi:hypothetical protein
VLPATIAARPNGRAAVARADETVDRLVDRMIASWGDNLTAAHRKRWAALVKVSVALFREGESEGALIQAVLDSQSAVWDEQDRAGT